MNIAKILVTFSMMVILPITSSSQWRKIANFKGYYINDSIPENIVDIYFLDLPGPPRVGYVGTESELWKTTDGGKSWNRSWSNVPGESAFPYGICFADSLTGWFVYEGYREGNRGGSAAYRTTDGGSTWRDLPSSFTENSASGFWYSRANHRLYLAHGDSLLSSTDSGNTWHGVVPYGVGNYVAFSDSSWIAMAWVPPADTIFGIIRTTDAGLHWSFAPESSFVFLQPLAIWGTPTCFAVNYGQMTVYRSDDYGKTWDTLVNYPFIDSNFVELGPYSMGIIRGDLSHLYIQTDSGMYLSTDEGKTWKGEGGPTQVGGPQSLFYASKGIAMAGMTYSDGAIEDGGLWEEDWETGSVSPPVFPDTNIFLSVNPTDGETELRFTLSQDAYVHTEVHDVLGRVVFGEPVGKILSTGEHCLPVDLRSAPAGTYYLTISLGTGEVRTIKLVKQ